MSKRSSRKLYRNAIRSIPFLNPRSRSVVPSILSAIGVAVLSGIAAVMIFSPRTRYRALGVAKDAASKVQNQIGQSGIGQKLGLHGRDVTSQPNGLGGHTSSYDATGL